MLKRGTFLLLISLMILSCGKEYSNIPDVPVNCRISLNTPATQSLNSPGGYIEITGYGVAGLIIYRSIFSERYLAYDRCSTVNPEQKCAVKVDSTGLTATDPCSKGVFSLEDGGPQKLPAEKPLKSYQVSISNNTIYVTN